MEETVFDIEMDIELKDLPKVSTNKIYGGVHWTTRSKIKTNYTTIIKSQFNKVFPKNKRYSVAYDFEFRIRPLDITNCSYMIKMIEDVIFEDDTYKIIEKVTITSKRGIEDKVLINVKQNE